jgi:ferredoxin
MAKIVFIMSDGERKEIDAKIGESIMRNAIDAGIDGIAAECGGCLSCATCHGYVGEAWSEKISAASEDEKVMVECAIDVRPTSRLTCQIMMTEELDGIEVEVPASQY